MTQPIEQDILCPLCEYNLRGLAEARCPECGAKFEWDELLDPAKRTHPYLFEHHPERKLWSLARTLLGGLRPRKFWTILLPVQASFPRRLVFYWILCLLLALGGWVAIGGLRVWGVYRAMASKRAMLQAYWAGPGVPSSRGVQKATTQEVELAIRQYGSVERMLDANVPLPPSRRFFSLALGDDESRWSSSFGGSQAIFAQGAAMRASKISIAGLAIWPWAAAVIMLLFRASMRRAAVRPIHLLRVAIYSADTFVMLNVAWFVFAGTQWLEIMLPAGVTRFRFLMWNVWPWFIGILPILFALFLTWRLGVGIGKYLRFRHALAMAISVQIIFVLLLLQTMVILDGAF